MKSGQTAGHNASESEDAAAVAMAEHELPIKFTVRRHARKCAHDGAGGIQ